MKLFYTLLALLCSSISFSQQTGSFQTTITHNGQPRTLEYFVPIGYNPVNEYPLVVGLHGCTGGANPAFIFRNQIAFLADSINAIVVCPEGLGSGMMDAPDHTMILASIDSTRSVYNIDTNLVYLTGFSCNGYVTAKYGTQQLYNWKGIIPIHAGISNADLGNGSFNYNNTTSTCIFIGMNDFNLWNNQSFRDSLIAHGADYFYNEIPGVGHSVNFPTFNAEMMECFNWFENGTGVGMHQQPLDLPIDIYPNPANNYLTISGPQLIANAQLEVLDARGAVVYTTTMAIANTMTLPFDYAPGIYYIRITTPKGTINQPVVKQ